MSRDLKMMSLDTIITAAGPTLSATDQAQWRIVYGCVVRDPAVPCPVVACKYMVDIQLVVRSFEVT